MIKAVVFDLDDTLILESEYIKSGFAEVANYISKTYNLNKLETYNTLLEIFSNDSKNVFNRFLDGQDITYNQDDIQKIIQIYRNHKPNIRLCADVCDIINKLKSINIKTGIISDGYINTQKNKIEALHLDEYIDNILLTDELGREYWKPHPLPFEIMAKKLNVEFEEMVYVGDNPKKDFYISSIYPIITVRIKRKDTVYIQEKYYKDVKPNYEIESLGQILDIIYDKNRKESMYS